MIEVVRNSGSHNTGSGNVGDHNTGSGNVGDYNTGNCNSGCFNTGSYNSGDWNSGNWNSGNWNSGCFNTVDAPGGLLLFNQRVAAWESIHFPKFLHFELTTGEPAGTLTYKEAFAQAYTEASEEEHAELFSLPNFDPEVFEEISGVDTTKEYARWCSRGKKL